MRYKNFTFHEINYGRVVLIKLNFSNTKTILYDIYFRKEKYILNDFDDVKKYLKSKIERKKFKPWHFFRKKLNLFK